MIHLKGCQNEKQNFDLFKNHCQRKRTEFSTTKYTEKTIWAPPAGKMKDTTEETRTINSCIGNFRHKDYESKKTLLKHKGIVNKAKRNFLTEQQIKHFGNDCNVMAEILISRYEHFIENSSVTHITTKLSASELENCYGNRVRSRLRQMFNLIAFDSETKDKR